MRRLAACGAALTGLSGVCLGLLAAWSRDGRTDDIMNVAVFVLCLAVAVYFLAVRLVLRGSRPRRALWVVLLVAAALRLPLLFGPPYLSSDIYRYVWDGRVQAAGINPYLFVPADPALAALRDEAIYPRINRAATAPTIYPPAAQVLFAAVGRVSQTVLAEKLMLAGFEALAILCGLGLLSLARLPPERILIYAWNPLAVWAFACDGHVDAAAIGLLAGALLLRCRGRDGWAGAAFGAAVLIKFLPLAAGPALWRRGRLVAAGGVRDGDDRRALRLLPRCRVAGVGLPVRLPSRGGSRQRPRHLAARVAGHGAAAVAGDGRRLRRLRPGGTGRVLAAGHGPPSDRVARDRAGHDPAGRDRAGHRWAGHRWAGRGGTGSDPAGRGRGLRRGDNSRRGSYGRAQSALSLVLRVDRAAGGGDAPPRGRLALGGAGAALPLSVRQPLSLAVAALRARARAGGGRPARAARVPVSRQGPHPSKEYA